MLKIDVTEDAHNSSELADLLRQVAEQLDNGYTSGYNPTWSMTGEEETTEEQ